MKILIATDNYYPNVNGASYFAQRHAVNLKAAGHDVMVIAPSRKFRDETFEHEGVKIFGIRSMPLKVIRVPLPFVISGAIRRAVLDFKPDVLHVQSHFAVVRKTVKAARNLGIPIVGTNHFMPENLVHYLHLPDSVERIIKRMAWNYFLKTFDHLDVVTSPSKAAANLLKEIGLKREILVISNGIDLKHFNPRNNGDYLKLKYNIPRKPILLFVGRVDKEKNIDVVLRALPKILEKTDIHFVIAGDGSEKGNLEKLAETLGLASRVTFTGFVLGDDLPNIFAIADCFIMAGTAELQSIVTMEAMATGLPIVAADSVALPELVRNGENGFLFTPYDTEKVSECVIKIFENAELREKMGQKSLEFIQKHDINRTTASFVSLYKELIKKSSSAEYKRNIY